jgi:putative MATE family efflux protein
MSLNKSAGMFSRFRGTFIGDRTFYSTVLTLVVPIIVQSAITSFVNLLDNIMVGQTGTAQMSGVAIANQLIFVFSLTIFGGLSGPGIFGAQFYGAGNIEGLRHTFRCKLWASALLLITAVTVFLTCGDNLISLFLTGEGNASDAAAMLGYGRDYLHIMLLGLLPFALSQAYGGTLRETGESMLQLIAGIAAVLTNLILNYILIFGKLGFPAMGVSGAAIATVISRYVELAIIVIYAHRHTDKFTFIKGALRSMKVPLALVKSISIKGLPLFVNELLWSLSMSALMQIFSTRGLNVVAGLNISSTVTNLFSVVFISMGTAVAVMVGQALGSGDGKRAKSYAWKLMFFSVCCCIVIGGVLAAASPFIPNAYNTTNDVRRLATLFMLTSAALMPFNAISHCSYFAIRSGGKTMVTFLFDSVYSWVVFIPYTYILVHYTNLSISIVYPLCYLSEAIKCVVGFLIVRTGYWVQNIVSGSDAAIPLICDKADTPELKV